jgi:hypothetical protein
VITKQAVAATLLLVLAAGCGGSSAASGVPVDSPSSPLGAGGDSLQICSPDLPGTAMTDGFTVLGNHSKGTAIIEQVSLYGAQHLKFVDAVVVPIKYDAIGASAGWPPATMNITQPGVQWDKRVPAVGARIPPSPAWGADRNLVIGVRPTAHEGIAAGVQVVYGENGQRYELRTHTEFEVLAAKSC